MTRQAMERLTILMPCKHQKREFFIDAVSSIVHQDSPYWELLVLTDPASPSELLEWISSFGDARVRLCPSPKLGFACALNFGLGEARTDFVSILLSDDRYALDAVSTLDFYQRRFPEVDFFHSSRRYIDTAGRPYGDVMPSREHFTLDYFKTHGSPVKHLLCWRVSKALEIGVMDETLSVHGCDDYDFPWRMAEAGARFQSVSECLYEYRVHHAHDRLTTTVPLERQVETISAMFARHRVPAIETDAYIQRAAQGYLIREFTDQIDNDRGALIGVRCAREAPAGAEERFMNAGFKQRHYFPHRALLLPKGGPDGFKLARRMMGLEDPSRLRELVLFALPPVSERFSDNLYFDDEVVWHQQQFGLRAQVAQANFVVERRSLRCYLLQSDLVQRISRAPEYRTQIDNAFKGWPQMLLNALLVNAKESGLEAVYVAASEFVLRHSDPRRTPKAALYERVYDRAPQSFGGVREGDWWRIDVHANAGRIAALDRRFEVDAWSKTVCITHDVERGLGHAATDPDLARRAEAQGPEVLRRMLDIESRLGVRATYNLVGSLFPQLEAEIRRGGHAISFHSYDHCFESDPEGLRQLQQCRAVDYRIKGYRAPQSKILPGLHDAILSEHNFEWFASSAYSFGFGSPRMESGIVKIPVHRDDYELYRDGAAFSDWESEVLEMIDKRGFVAIGLHDCYAHLWLDRYEEFLGKIRERAALMTLDEVAARVTLGQAYWFESA